MLVAPERRMAMDKRRRNSDLDLPDEYQIEAEIREAEASGAHKEEVDMLDEVNMWMALDGHIDDRLPKPTNEELSE